MEMDSKEFCSHLDRWKRETGKKDIDFCNLLGIHPNTLVNWKKGRSAPQADKMKRICETLQINEVDLQPMSFYTAQDNANKLYYRTQQLQQYANRKGLSDEFYKRITSEPYFLKEFPFSSTRSRFFVLNCPEYLAEDEKYLSELMSIPLKKYEFKDDYGEIIMLTEDDIDFLVELQRKSEQLIRHEFRLEKYRKNEIKIVKLVSWIARQYLEEDGSEIDSEQLYEDLTKTDFSEGIITSSTIWRRFNNYAEEHNLRSKRFGQIIKADLEEMYPPMSEEERESWKQHYINGGMTEEEAEEKLKSREELRKRILNIRTDHLEGGNDNGKH